MDTDNQKRKTKNYIIVGMSIAGVLIVAGIAIAVALIIGNSNADKTNKTPSSNGLSELQKVQRDTSRRQDVGRVIAGLLSYLVDNKNRFPTNAAAFNPEYYRGDLIQANKVIFITADDGAGTTQDTITIRTGYDCNDTANARKGAVRIQLESTGANYCQEL